MKKEVIQQIMELADSIDWVIGIDPEDEEMSGMIVGTEEYVTAMAAGDHVDESETETNEEVELQNQIKHGTGARRLIYLGRMF